MVEAHGSQCGFCTPGFIMSLFTLWRQDKEPSTQRIDDALAGNLCRCTGYGTIVNAARAMRSTDGAVAHIADREAEVAAELRALDDNKTLTIEYEGRRFYAPATIDQLAAILLLEHPTATVLAGSTDVGLWVTKQHRVLETMVYVGRIAELRQIVETKQTIEIGAAVTCSDGMAALAAEWPDLGEIYRRFASVQIRNAATIGGNIANGSPIGDTPPALIAAGATLVLRCGAAQRTMPLEAYFLAYGQQDRRPGEFVEKVIVPRREAGQRFRAYKISKRFDQDISAVMAAFRITLDGDMVRDARIAYGGMAAIPKRATAAEAALLGKPWRRDAVEAAMMALGQDFTPLTDMRASAGYRLRVAQNLLLKCFVETSEPAAQTRLVGDLELAHV
jgi:xanthine dehydrogenase small subunit